jgi:PAS domain S-box-containing protein
VTTRTAVGLWTLAVGLAAGGVSLVVTSDHRDTPTTTAVMSIAVGLAFVGAGLVAWYRRPENRTGLLMVLVGFAWYAGSLVESNASVPFTVGVVLASVAWGFFAYLLLAFPSGRLSGRVDYAIVITAFLLVTVARFVWVLFTDLREDFPGAPENAFLVEHDETVSTAVEMVVRVTGIVIIAATVTVLVRRWRAASPPLRRALGPVFVTAGTAVTILAVQLAFEILELRAADAVYWVALGALLTVPLSFLLGLVRGRLARAGVSRLLLELDSVRSADDLRDALARALGDPSLEVAYWIPERNEFVDAAGKGLPARGDDDERLTTVVERGGEPVAALVHDASLRDEADLVAAVGAAAGLALENERRLAKLAQSEARQRALIHALPDLMIRISRDGTYLDVEANDADLVLPARELVGRTLHEVLPLDVADRIMRCVERLPTGSGVETVEYALRLDGVDRHFEARIAPIADDDAVLIVRDISDRKRTELELQRLQDELRARYDDLRRERDFISTVVQAAPSFFCLVDGEGGIVRFNRTLERASGLKDEEATRGRPFWEAFSPPDKADAVREALLAACCLPASALREREDEWRAADGGRISVAWSVTPLLDEQGEQRFLITGMDITQRKRHEEELRSSRARIVEAGAIERRRLERNLHDGAQQRLVSLSLLLSLAQGRIDADPAGAKELLATADDELKRALEELRELARGIHPAVLTDRGLEPAVQALVTRSPVPVTLAETPDDRFPEPVEAAAYYVVSEALANVVKYSGATEATVRIARDNGFALVEVADDGVGGADPSRGSGLRGLADRVEALDGRLEVESAPGDGTTVRAQIPYG